MNYSRRHHAVRARQGPQSDGDDTYIMETGFRERQAISPLHQPRHALRAAARLLPGRPDDQPRPLARDQQRPAHLARPVARQAGRSRRSGLERAAGTATSASAPAADQESFTVMDDDYYDALAYHPDTRDSTRRGLGLRDRGARFPVGEPAGRERDLLALRHHQRGHHRLRRQHHLRALHGLGRGRLARSSCDGIFESDDDNAFFDKSLGSQPRLHLGPLRPRRRPLGPCDRTGYLGYAYLETPGNALDARRRRRRRVRRRAARRRPRGRSSWARTRSAPTCAAHYDTAQFERVLRTARRAARRTGSARGGPATRTWTGSPSSTTSAPTASPRPDDTGEGDGMPTDGRAELRPHRPERVGPDRAHRLQDEPHPRGGRESRSDRRQHRCSSPTTRTGRERLYEKFTDPDPAARFDAALAVELQHRLPVRLRTVHAQGRQDASASAWRSPTAPTSPSCATNVQHRAADLQRELPVRGAAAAAHASPPRRGTATCASPGTTSPSAASIR